MYQDLILSLVEQNRIILEQLIQLKRTVVLPAAEADLPYSEWLKKWFNLYKAPKNGTRSLDAISGYMKNNIIPAIGNYTLAELSPALLQSFLNEYTNRPNTQHKIAQVLNGSLNKARINRILQYNPAEGLVLSDYEKQSYPVLELEAQRRMLNAIKLNKYKQLFFFLCCTGLRIGEALAVKCEHIDKKQHFINVIKKHTRTKGGCRKIPYLPELFYRIETYFKGPLFPNITYNSAKLYLQKVSKKLKIDFTLHSTRHTFISCCYHIGIKDKQIQTWAGHADIGTTLNTYTHLLDNGTSPILDYLRALKTHLENKK